MELHVFGPGYGESLLIHAGHNQWPIVDSCKRSRTARPATIEWLEHIGLDPSQVVTHVVATHWHDDHVRGMGETLESCRSARFVCSSALLSEELLALAMDAVQPLKGNSSGLDELRRIVTELRRRKRQSASRMRGTGLLFASADTRLLWREDTHPTCEVWSLSPSSAEIELSLRQFAAMLADTPTNAAKPVVRPARPIILQSFSGFGKVELLEGACNLADA